MTRDNATNWDALAAKYPGLYRVCKHFSCGPGWYGLIDQLSAKLEPICRDTEMYAVQVKEKFGTLRFYMSDSTDEIDRLIDEAETKSATTCEVCGDEGRLIETGWLSVRCAKCGGTE